jgi:hypothetical protein
VVLPAVLLMPALPSATTPPTGEARTCALKASSRDRATAFRAQSAFFPLRSKREGLDRSLVVTIMTKFQCW